MSEQIVQVYSAAEIAGKIKALAADIAQDYQGRELTVLGVLDDSFMFLADLLRALNVPLHTAFLRYDQHSVGGVQDISFSTQMDVARRDIILVEGVLDTGVTQEYIIKQLGAYGASSIKLCVLIDKPNRRRVALQPEWRAFETHESYIFGYGLGFQGRWRELPYLATLAGARGAEEKV
jgi:hypoxanthine phosphoribosyltransferase